MPTSFAKYFLLRCEQINTKLILQDSMSSLFLVYGTDDIEENKQQN